MMDEEQKQESVIIPALQVLFTFSLLKSLRGIASSLIIIIILQHQKEVSKSTSFLVF